MKRVIIHDHDTPEVLALLKRDLEEIRARIGFKYKWEKDDEQADNTYAVQTSQELGEGCD